MMARLAAQTTEKVDGGTEAADKTARALDLVVKGTEVIGTMVDRISGAVSYTHLDVYKRQRQYSSVFRAAVE